MFGQDWTAEQVEELRRLRVDEKIAIKAICAKIGRSKMSVVAKLHRMGISTKKAPGVPRSQRRREQRAREGAQKDGRRRANWTALGAAPHGHPWNAGEKVDPRPITDASPGLPIGAEAVDMEAVAPHHCRWIYGDPTSGEGYFFCGRPKMEGSSYCRGHFIIGVRADHREAARKRAEEMPDVGVPEPSVLAVEPSGAAGDGPDEQHDDDGKPFEDFPAPRVIPWFQIGSEAGEHEPGGDRQQQEPMG